MFEEDLLNCFGYSELSHHGLWQEDLGFITLILLLHYPVQKLPPDRIFH